MSVLCYILCAGAINNNDIIYIYYINIYGGDLFLFSPLCKRDFFSIDLRTFGKNHETLNSLRSIQIYFGFFTYTLTANIFSLKYPCTRIMNVKSLNDKI